MNEQPNIPSEAIDQMDPVRPLVVEARRRLIRQDAARAEVLRPQLAVARAALEARELEGAGEIERKRAAFAQAQAQADRAQDAYVAAQRTNDANCIPLRAEVARLIGQLNLPSSGFAQRDPNQWRLEGDLGPAGAAGLRRDRTWIPAESHPVGGPLNPKYGH